MARIVWLPGLVTLAVLAGALLLTVGRSAEGAGARDGAGRAAPGRGSRGPSGGHGPGIRKIVKSDAEWRKLLTPQQYHVLREKGTDYAFTGALVHNGKPGLYVCAACGLELFGSDTKFDSGTGWPSFYAPIARDHVELEGDHSLGMERDEVVCARCGGHLGHLFDDGPAPTYKRYCMNSSALRFVAR